MLERHYQELIGYAAESADVIGRSEHAAVDDPSDHGSEARADLRGRWLDLMRRRLPTTAAWRPEWPIRRDHCFGRVVLDTVHGRPWREAVRAPAWRHMDTATLARAVALGEAILDGTANLRALNSASLAMREKSRMATANHARASEID